MEINEKECQNDIKKEAESNKKDGIKEKENENNDIKISKKKEKKND